MSAATLDLFPTSPPAFPSSPQWTGPEAPQEPKLFRTYSGSQLCKSTQPPGTAAPDRHAWLDEVSAATFQFRNDKADALLQRAAERVGAREEQRKGWTLITDEGWLCCPVQSPPEDARDAQPWEVFETNPSPRIYTDTRWYENRAAALRDKQARVKNCGTSALVQQCTDCGVTKDVLIRCRDTRLCLHCRTARIADYVSRFAESHTQRHARNVKAGYTRDLARHGYRWSPKFLTLTITHGANLAHDLAVFPKAWAAFRQLQNNHLRIDRGLTPQMLADVAYVRVLEITPGGFVVEEDATDEERELAKAKGHAHSHVYYYGPFIHQALLAHWWGKAVAAQGCEVRSVDCAELLSEQEDPRKRAQLQALLVTRRGANGRPLQKVYRPIVHINQCRGSAKKIGSELAKYIIKDGQRDKATGELVFVDPQWFAVAYEAMYGRRAICASRFFWSAEYIPEPQNVRCNDCGGWHVTTYFAVVEVARGPPDVVGAI